MRMNTTWRAFGALTLASALILTGCGDKKDDSAKAGDAPAKASTSGSDLQQANFLTTVGDAQIKAKTSHVTMTMKMAGQSVTAEGDMRTGKEVKDSAVAMKMNMGGQGALEMRVVDGIMYMNMGPMSGNQFMKVDLNDTSSPLTQQYGNIFEQFDSASQLKAYEKSLKSLTEKGDGGTIDGVNTTEWVLVLDPAKIAETTGVDATALPKDMSLTMFIGEDNLPRKVLSVMNAAGANVEMEMLYTKWGEPVDISAPPKDQISDKSLAELAGAGQ